MLRHRYLLNLQFSGCTFYAGRNRIKLPEVTETYRLDRRLVPTRWNWKGIVCLDHWPIIICPNYIRSNHGSVGGEFTARDIGFEDRPQHLGIPRIALIVGDSIGFRIAAGDTRCSEDYVPEEKHISKVALVLAYAIIGTCGVMRVMGCGCGNGRLQYPGDGMK